MTSTKFKPGMIFLILSAEELNFTPEKNDLRARHYNITVFFKKKKKPCVREGHFLINHGVKNSSLQIMENYKPENEGWKHECR